LQKRHNKPRHATTSSRSVEMPFRIYNPNPVTHSPPLLVVRALIVLQGIRGVLQITSKSYTNILQIDLEINHHPDGDIIIDVTSRNILQTFVEQIIINTSCIDKIAKLEARFQKYVDQCEPKFPEPTPAFLKQIKNSRHYIGSIKSHANCGHRTLRFYGTVINSEVFLVCRQESYSIEYIILPKNFFAMVRGL